MHSTLAARLAGAGWRVVMIDKDPLGSDTLSSHLVFPDTLVRPDQLGVLDALRSRHALRPVLLRQRVLGREFVGPLTPIGGHDRGLCIRRPVLDRALAEAALAVGAEARFGERVAGPLGAGTDEDRVRGIVLEPTDGGSTPPGCSRRTAGPRPWHSGSDSRRPGRWQAKSPTCCPTGEGFR